MNHREPAPSHHPALFPAGFARAVLPPKTGVLIDVAVATLRDRKTLGSLGYHHA